MESYQQIWKQLLKNTDGQYSDKIKVIGYEKNRGLGYALQKGILECDYDYIARMDSDDIARKERFEVQMSYLEKHPEIDVLGSYLQEYDEKMQKRLAVRKVPLSCEQIYKNLGMQSPFNHSTVILKKETVIKVGNYKAEPIEDYKLWIQMCLNGKKMVNLPQILVNYRTGISMYKRRTGISYLCKIKEVQNILLESNVITYPRYIKNILIRLIVALIPSRLKLYIYPKIIRKLKVSEECKVNYECIT